MSDQIKAGDLNGVHLAFWAAKAMGHEPRLCSDGSYVIVDNHPWSLNWTTCGQMVAELEMSVSSPHSPVHRSGGDMPGWGPRTTWGACTWAKGADGRRSFGDSPDSPLDAIARCYVRHHCGKVFERHTGKPAPATHKCGRCMHVGAPDDVMGCRNCGWDEMLPTAVA